MLLWIDGPKGDPAFNLVEYALRKKFPGVEIVATAVHDVTAGYGQLAYRYAALAHGLLATVPTKWFANSHADDVHVDVD